MTGLEFEDISYEEGVRRHRQNRHEKLLRETTAVFAKSGISHVSMDTVAKEVGVTKVILYRYFHSKNELVDLILETLVDRILLADARDLWWGHELLAENIKVIRENQDAFMLMMRHARHDPIFERHYRSVYDGLVDHTLKRINSDYNAIADGALDLNFFAERICGFLLDSIGEWIECDDPDNDEIFVHWLVKSVAALAATWSGFSFDGPMSADG